MNLEATFMAVFRLVGMVGAPALIAGAIALVVTGAAPVWTAAAVGFAGGAMLRCWRPLTVWRLACLAPRLVTGRALGRCTWCHIEDRSRRWCVLRFTLAPEYKHGRMPW